jgi:hypothetical protein
VFARCDLQQSVALLIVRSLVYEQAKGSVSQMHGGWETDIEPEGNPI